MGKILKRLIDEDPCTTLSEDTGVVIDFSSPEGTEKAIAMGRPLVCGTTGLSDSHFAKLKKLAKTVPVLYAPNFSIGMSLCYEMLEQIAEKAKQFAKIELSETHNEKKKDAPSGSAIKLAEVVGIDKSEVACERVPEVAFKHQVKFLLHSETIILQHEALSRDVFAEGALIAAKFIFDKPAKFYTLRDVFG